jgi:hypothetical protein
MTRLNSNQYLNHGYSDYNALYQPQNFICSPHNASCHTTTMDMRKHHRPGGHVGVSDARTAERFFSPQQIKQALGKLYQKGWGKTGGPLNTQRRSVGPY